VVLPETTVLGIFIMIIKNAKNPPKSFLKASHSSWPTFPSALLAWNFLHSPVSPPTKCCASCKHIATSQSKRRREAESTEL
jgi:hypothetical protein